MAIHERTATAEHLCPAGDRCGSDAPSFDAALSERPGRGFIRLGDALGSSGWRDRLAKLAITEPDDQDQPACQRCRGAGYLRRNVPPDDPLFGQLVRCPECAPRPLSAAELADRQAKAIGLSANQRRQTFANWRTAPGSTRAFAAASDYAARPGAWLVIYGNRGAGKSHLGLAIVNALIDSGRAGVRWHYVPDLVAAAMAEFRGDDAGKLLTELKATSDVLVLDDLGQVHISATEWGIQAFLAPLLDARYRDTLPTVITCKADPEAIKANLSESIGRRMQDRLVCVVVENQAPQYQAPSAMGRND